MYKLAFIGGSCESIAGYPHFIASQMDNRFKVVAGAFSSQQHINQSTAEKWGVSRLYSSWKELIQKEKGCVDAVVILMPTPSHIDVIIELLKNNIPIICEKPLVQSVEEINRIKCVYEESKHFLVVTNNYSGYPMVRDLQQRIKLGELGDILQVRLKMPQESFLRPPKSIKYPQKWRLKDAFIPMISLDLGAHLHHLAYFLLQEEPIQVLATYDSFSHYKVIDNVNMLLEYKSGVKGNFWLSKSALGNRNGLHIEVYGSKASAVWHQEQPEVLILSKNNGEKLILDRGADLTLPANPLYNRMTPGHPAGFIESFANLYNDIFNELTLFMEGERKKEHYVYGFKHAESGINLLHCASISEQNKSWVNIE